MAELINAFDAYSDFSRDSYFVISFDCLASTLMLEVLMVATQKNMNKVLEATNLSENEFEIVFKTWSTEDSSNADFDADYPYELLFKSRTKKLLIWIQLNYETLSVDFLYDCTNLKLEKWVINLNDQLRKQFGLSKTPTFNVLSKSHSNFITKEVRTENIQLDVSKNYNDDFFEISQKIKNAIPAERSGVILLHGKPGTGKTTFIRSLISEFQDANFIFIQNEFVKNLLEPDFIPFLLKQRNAILIIEDAEKVISSRENINAESVVSTILQLTDGLFSDYLNIKIICTFNTHLSKIDTGLLRKGRMIAMYEFLPLSIKKTNKLLQSIGVEMVSEELTISDIFNFEQSNYSNLKKTKIGFFQSKE